MKKPIKVILAISTFIIVMFSVITTLVDISVFGVVKSKYVLEAINNNKNDTIICEGSFLRIGKMPTIYKRSGISFFKYQIYNVGEIYRFTEASEKIDSIYNTFEKTDRQKLGLDK